MVGGDLSVLCAQSGWCPVLQRFNAGVLVNFNARGHGRLGQSEHKSQRMQMCSPPVYRAAFVVGGGAYSETALGIQRLYLIVSVSVFQELAVVP